jgi:hypothetical protein
MTNLGLIFIHLLTFPHFAMTTLSDAFQQHLVSNGLLQLDGIASHKRPWPTRISFHTILREFVDDSTENRFVINLGAQDGDNYDPVFELLVKEKILKRYYSGIFIEASEAHEKSLRQNTRMFNQTGNMQIYIEYALPTTIVARLQSGNCPSDPDVLKVDIDSVDLPVLQAIFQTSAIRPKVVMAEVNSDMPLPFMWYQKEIRIWRSETYFGNYGTGVYALYDLMDSTGYVPIGVELGSSRGDCVGCEHNVFFLRKDLYQQKTNHDVRYNITFLDFSRSFWISLLEYSNYSRKHANEATRKALQLNTYAVSCVQLYFQHCPYTLMQLHGQKEPSFQDRNFKEWQTWYDLQLFLMTPSGNNTATRILKTLVKQFRRLDMKSGAKIKNPVYILPNALVTSTLHQDSTIINNSAQHPTFER